METQSRRTEKLDHKADDTVLFDHYRALTTKNEAEKFFGITPKAEATKIVSFASWIMQQGNLAQSGKK